MYRLTLGIGLLVTALLAGVGYAEDKPKDEKAAPLPYGTVTKTKRIPGDQDAKGDCRKLVQGGYMKFDLSKYPKDHKFERAQLKVFVKKHSGNGLRWVSLLTVDPTVAKVEEVFNQIQKHKILLTGFLSIRRGSAGKWLTFNLNRKATQFIKARLAEESPEKKWIAMTLAFE